MTPYLVTFGLFILGLACIAVELLIIPGFGFVGILGGAILLGDVIYAWMTIGPLTGGLVLILSLGSAAAGVWIVMHTRIGRRLRHQSSLAGSASAVSVGREHLVGREGVAASHLRPSGVALVDGERIDVITEGEFIERGTRVRIKAVEGPKIIVETVGGGVS
jgi:membrane-bound serine protease (ClpP class)